MSNKKYYFECYSGISGDMTVAALLDLGANRNVLLDGLKSLNLDGFNILIAKVNKNGVSATDFNVDTDVNQYDHDMEYLHGHDHNHDHNHEHNHQHPHVHRNFLDIKQIIENSKITHKAKEMAIKMFEIIAIAESKAHNLPMDQVHFHEVGAIDSIVDIVSVAICMDNLGIEKIYTNKICEGTGTVRCQHGILPIPVPATLNIISDNNIPVEITAVEGELITPTGASVIAAYRTDEKPPKTFKINKIGIGAGKREYNCPGILRIMEIESTKKDDKKSNKDQIIKVESNIDDTTGEELGVVMSKIFEKGALDVFFTSIFMKKNRPAYLLTALCKESSLKEIEKTIFENTTTIGIRKTIMERTVLNRKIQTVDTPIGKVKVKICEIDGIEKIYPEYESLIPICKENNLSYGEAYKIVASCL